jgi:hypothetical protein
MCKKVTSFFLLVWEIIKSFSLTNILFKIILLNNEEITTVRLAIESKKKRSALWYANNLIAPFIIVYSPYLLYRVSSDFGVISFEKNLIDLSITGGVTLLGINVMRISLTLMNEKIDDSKIPIEIRKDVMDDIESIKSKLRFWIAFFTIIGAIGYFIQAAGFLKSSNPQVIWYVLAILIVCVISILLGRLITIIQSNFFDNDNLIKLWLSAMKQRTASQYSSLRASAEQGL